MTQNKLLQQEDIEAITPSKIADDIYQFLVLDWKSSSLVALKETKEPKNLKRCIQDIVEMAYEKSEFWYSSLIPDLGEKIIEEKQKQMRFNDKEGTVRYKQMSQLARKLNEVYDQEKANQTLDHLHFSDLITKEIRNKYLYTEQLRPNYWEQFMKDYYDGKGIDAYQRDYEKQREKAFQGVSFSEIEDTKFFNNVALPFVAQKAQYKSRVEILTEEIVNYTTKLHEFKNTHQLTQRLLALKNQDVNEIKPGRDFSDILKHEPKMLEIEKRYKEKKEHSQLNGVLNKIKNKA